MIVNSSRASATQICIAWPGLTSIPFEGLGKGRKIRLNEEDVDAIRREARGLNAISSEYSETLKLNYGTKTIAVDISGVSPEFGDMRNLIPQAGRPLHQPDRHRRAAPRPLHRQQARRRTSSAKTSTRSARPSCSAARRS